VEGVDALLIGTNDLSLEMGIAGQIGDARIQAAYEKVGADCRRHGKIFAMGGVYDREWSARYRQRSWAAAARRRGAQQFPAGACQKERLIARHRDPMHRSCNT
jgi:2-keto-3-deoxy-L-rhamnonate aldolase RhmA